MISNSEWFDKDWTKFEDWWRGIYNRVTVTNNKITAVLV